MGLLIDGVWHDQWYDTASTGGRFERAPTRFHGRVSADGGSGFPAEPGRYHLYVSLACPWAHRTLILRALKRLEDVISVLIVDPVWGDQGWRFSEALPDTVTGAEHLHQVYTLAEPRYTGRVTVPILWDRQTRRIVNNESAEIIRMLNREFDAFGDASRDFYPEPLRARIDEVNGFVYDHVNNGVYRTGFATTQAAYEEAFDRLFAALDRLEALLAGQRYLVGEQITEADWRLFTTLVRFDSVYVGHFKCNRQRLVDYPNLWGYTRDLYQVPGIAHTVNMDHIKLHYYCSHPHINPNRIVPMGPVLDFVAAPGRDRLPGRSLGESA